ncbi:MAG: hypothetical protein Kow0090_15580 [Myxococcota bacterium]
MNPTIEVKGFVEKFFNIRPNEFKRVALMFIYSLFAMGGALVIGRTVSNALFLANLAEQYIPYRYIGMAVGIPLAAIVYTRLVTLVNKVTLNISVHTAIVLLLILFRALLYFFAENIYVIAALYFFFEIMGALVTIQFWNFATEVFHAREAKRLFGIIAAGGIISNVIAGGFVRTAVKTIGAPDLIWSIALSMLICIAVVHWLRGDVAEKKRKKISTRKFEKSEETSFADDLKKLRYSPQLLSIAAIVAITAVVTNIADYQLSVVLKINYSVTQISSFYGDYFLVCGIIASVIQIFFTGKFLHRFGILFALTLLPSAMLLGFLSTIFFTALYTIAPTRGADTVLRYTVNESTLKLLYLPVDANFRPRATSIIDGMFKPIATGFAGVLFIFMRSLNVSLVYYSFLAVFLLVIWVLLAARARRQYIMALGSTLLSRRLDLASATVNIDDSTMRFLIKTLHHKSPPYILHALEIIRSTHKVNWDPHIGHLLEHPDAEVKAAALSFLAEQESTAHFSKVLKLLDGENQSVTAAAIKAICALNPNYAMMAVSRYLQHENPEIKSVAIVGMIKNGGLDGILMAAGELKAMLEHHDWRMRMSGARVLGELNVQTFYHPLIKLINDGHRRVQIEAISAAGQLRSKHLMTLLIYKLADKQLQSAAIQALIKYGDSARDALVKVMLNRSENTRIRRAIPKILQESGGEKGARALLEVVKDKDVKLRHAALAALAAVSFAEKNLKLDAAELESAAFEEAKRFCESLAIEDDLRELDANGIIRDSLEAKREYALDRIFYVIQALHPEENIQPIRRGLKSAKKHIRANAVEFLDNLLESNLKRFILPILEDLPADKRAEVGRELFEIPKFSAIERIEQLARDDDEWLQTVALFTIGEKRLTNLDGLLFDKFDSRSEIVQETALLSLTKIVVGERLTESLKTIIDKETLLVREYALRLLKEKGV